MLGPKYTVSDVAVLLETGLRDGSIVLALPEEASQSKTLVKQSRSRDLQRFIPALVSVAVAIIFAVIVIPVISIGWSEGANPTSLHKGVEFVTHGPGAFLTVPAVLVGYRDLVQVVVGVLKRRLKIEPTVKEQIASTRQRR